MKHRANTPRLAILACLPATQAQIHEKTGVSQGAISRWLTYLRACSDAHIGGWTRSPNCPGIIMAVYHPGPGADVVCKLKRMTQRDRDRRSRAVRRKTGEWADVLQRQRARYWRDKPTRRDPLTAALFGRA